MVETGAVPSAGGRRHDAGPFESAAVHFDLTTKKGQDQWKLSYPTRDITRQALEDAVRTQEVIIKGEIPYDAIEQL